jgi:hypothetical protein
MRSKKPLLLIPFILLVVVLALGITGLAVAAPATAVKGTCEFLDMHFDIVSFDDVSGDVVLVGWEEYWMTGDLVGEYREELTVYANVNSLYHTSVGEAFFEGTLKGKADPVIWTARLYSTGETDPSDLDGGKGHAKDTLTSGMKGQITFQYSFGYGKRADYYVYTGELK